MTEEAFESIRQGLIEAIDFARGKATGARVHHVSVRKIESQTDRRPD